MSAPVGSVAKAPENPYSKPGFVERTIATVVREVLHRTIGTILNEWGPQDLLIAIATDVDLLASARENFPQQVEAGRRFAGIFPKADEQFAEQLVYEWLKKHYPQMFVYTDSGVPIEVLASPQGKAWLFRNIKKWRDYLWGT